MLEAKTGERVESERQDGCLYCQVPADSIVRGLVDNRFGTRGSYEIRRCRRCGIERIWPEPSLAELKTLYESEYNFGGEAGTLYTRLREWFFQSKLYRLWIWIDGDISFHRRAGSGRLLDIGCNEGRGLPIYQRNGFRVEGLEINAKAAMHAARAGFKIHSCLLEELTPAALYDVAVLSNVLEHALDPAQMLRDVYRILAPGGQVWISCPNAQSWLRRVFGRSWINWHVPFHITHFSSRTLTTLLEASGYMHIETRQITPALWVAHSLITYLFATEAKKNLYLRNPVLIFFLISICRLLIFPVLWLGNKIQCGDCLLVTAEKR